MVIPENVLIGEKGYLCTVRLVSRFDLPFLYNFCTAITHIFGLAIPERLNLKALRQSIHRFNTDAIQTDRFFESFRIIFCSGIHFR